MIFFVALVAFVTIGQGIVFLRSFAPARAVPPPPQTTAATEAGVGEGAVASRNAASTASIDSSDSPSKSKYIAANDRFGKIDVSVHD